MKYFNYCVGLTMTNDRFARLFDGLPRKPESQLTQREMDLARSIQEVTEEIMLRMARHVHKEDQPLYYEMIKAFRDKTGCLVIINTSFNVRGEPIVWAPEHA